MYERLKEQVCRANIELKNRQLVIYSWGNVSGINRGDNIVAIKPSGIAYRDLTPDKIVLLDLDGNTVEGDLNPSSDMPTHLELYRNFKDIGGICHTHSPSATMWAQACREIPCLGTTHADYFYGGVPVTDTMTAEEIHADYELNTGKVIVRRFDGLKPLQMPAVLVANHGPFTWGKDPAGAVESAVVLEQTAEIALGTITINPRQKAVSKTLLDKHYLRKHGKNAYYGQK
jgi:L-ribulose-5-phosphate 4-epimerase